MMTLSDKLSAKGNFVEKREAFTRQAAAFQALFMPKEPEDQHAFFQAFQHLLQLNAELAQAPLLFTLQSAAEVGFAHATVRPIATPEKTEEEAIAAVKKQGNTGGKQDE